MKYKSLTNKLVVYFVVVSLTALSIFAILAYLQSKDAITERTFEQLTSIKNIKKRQLERHFNDILTSTDDITKKISSIFCTINYNYSDKDFSLIKEYINQNKYINKAFLFITDSIKSQQYEINKDSIIILSTNELQFLNSLKLKDNCFRMAELFEKKQNISYILYLSKPVLNHNNQTKINLIIELNTLIINEIMYETNPNEGVGFSGESFITNTEGKMLTKSRFIDSSVMSITINTEGLHNAVAGINGTGLYKDYRGIAILGSYCKLNIKGLDWYIFAEIDSEEANKPIFIMRNKLTLLAFIVSTVILFVTFLLSKKFTIPIINLTTASEKISKGEYPPAIEIVSNDEIAILTISFNEMIEKLKFQEKQLEQEKINRIKAAIDTLDEERKRLSRELHDGLGQSIIAVKLKLEAIEINNRKTTIKQINEIGSSLDSIIKEIRHISNDLMPPVLQEFGISNAIRYLCDELDGYSDIRIIFNSNITNLKLNSREQLYFFRVSQEAIKNAIQHSKANKIMVELNCHYNKLILKVSDNGTGFNINYIDYGNGIYNMNERAKLIGATLSIECPIDNGTILTLSMNLSEPNND